MTDNVMQQTDMFMQETADISCVNSRSSLKKICQYRNVCVSKWEGREGLARNFKFLFQVKYQYFRTVHKTEYEKMFSNHFCCNVVGDLID